MNNRQCVICSSQLIDNQSKYCSPPCVKEGTKQRKRKYVAANRDRVNAQARKDAAAARIRNPDKVRARKRAFYHKHKEKISEQQKAKRTINREDKLKKRREYRKKNRDRILYMDRLWKENNKDKFPKYNSDYYAKNKENSEFIEKRKTYRDANAERQAEWNKEWRKNNKERKYLSDKNYRIENKVKINLQIREKKKTNLNYKLRVNMSTFIARVLKKNGTSKRGFSCMQFVDWSIEQLRQHLESQFESWMCWENHGKYNKATWDDKDSSTWTWQIDHIIPVSSFTFESMADLSFKECWSLNNLRPLSSKQNLIKGKKY